MTAKKQTAITYPEPQPELAAAVAELQAAVDTVEHVKQTVREWPAKVAQAETELADSEREVDRAETDLALARGDKSAIEAKVKTRTAEAAEKRETLNRLRSRLPHLNERGEEANAELERVKQKVRTEQSIYVKAVQEAIAGPYAEIAAVLAQHVAQHDALIQAAGYGLSTGRFDRARVPDIRQPAHDLLSDDVAGAVAASVAAMGPTLEPLRVAVRLLKTARFDPRPSIASRR